MFHVPEQFRVVSGALKSNASDGNNGVFYVRVKQKKLTVVASDGEEWEHVSISYPMRTPSWADMHAIKKLFWDSQDLVVQLHPPESDYINNCSTVLHLWRKANTNDYCERPPGILVGL